MSTPTPFLIFSLLFSLILLLSLSSAAGAGDDTPTAYDLLASYDFPIGILPKGVTGYELNSETGEFKVYLEKTCKFNIESYQLEYKSTISGVISPGKLSKLKGVSVKVLLLWLSIVEVDKDDDELAFSVGIASARFPLDGFEESPQCGCGFDCVNGGLSVRVGGEKKRENGVENMVASS